MPSRSRTAKSAASAVVPGSVSGIAHPFSDPGELATCGRPEQVRSRRRSLRASGRRTPRAGRPRAGVASGGGFGQSRPRAMREKELRIALVCFGGISLAVYMHGISKEILKLVRASAALHRVRDRQARLQARFSAGHGPGDPEYDTEA